MSPLAGSHRRLSGTWYVACGSVSARQPWVGLTGVAAGQGCQPLQIAPRASTMSQIIDCILFSDANRAGSLSDVNFRAEH